MSSDTPHDPETATPCAYTEYVRRTDADAVDLPATGEHATGLEGDVWDALYDVEDPEMPVSIVDLGLIYGVDCETETPSDTPEVDTSEADATTHVTVLMTLTYTGCPARDMLLDDVEAAVRSVDGVASAAVELVWSPEWSLELVTEQGKADLQEFGVSV